MTENNHHTDKEDVNTTLKRNLTPRMLNMIAIGGAIGTGIFLASGNAIATSGPGGTIVAYALMGLMVYFLMTSLGEMSAFMPTTGSFYAYASHFVDPSLGFALGWNYWYNWAITVASEIAAASLIMRYWFPDSGPFLWCTLFVLTFFLINALSVRAFGEAEYWFSFIKVSTIIIFIIVGLCLAFGTSDTLSTGFRYWHIGDGPFHNGLGAIFGAFMIAGFSFQGTELIGIAAGESENPKTTIPKAVKQVFWRILLFFILSIFVITLIIPYTSPLLTNNDVNVSPFTLVFQQIGISHAASIMNAVILTAVLSAGNSGMYAATRMLWYLSKQGHVPKIFSHVNKRGVPFAALLATTAVSLLAFLTSLFGNGTVYFWLLNASSLSGFIAWLGIAISHYRFRKAYLLQGRDLKELPYVARGYPYAPLLAFAMCLIIIGGQNYQAFLKEHIDWYGLVVSYIGLPIFIALWFGYKWRHKTKIVDLQTCSLSVNSH